MHAFVNLLIRWALLLFSRHIVVDGRIGNQGPLLVLANHPNGFLDGILIASRFRRPVFFLGRGELFQSRLAWRLVKLFRVLPLYHAGRNPRLQSLNEAGLAACRKVWERSGVVILFAEGETKPEWGLREIKKTAFRLADPVSNNPGNEKLQFLTIGLHYHPFRGAGKNILLRTKDMNLSMSPGEPPAKRAAIFQESVRKSLLSCLLSGPAEAVPFFENKSPEPGRLLFVLPAGLGFLLHAPLYLPIKAIVNGTVKRPAFRESNLFLALFFLYPVYWVSINVSAWYWLHSLPVSLLLLLMPFWARCYILWRKRPGYAVTSPSLSTVMSASKSGAAEK